MKYCDGIYTLSKKENESIKNKILSFQKVSGTKYAIHPVLVTTEGLHENIFSGIIQAVITIGDLFLPN
ncbi:MAG: hypothetical protein IKS48_08675 [Eubacterium sp.]|nr:hypothetical protein [Eubacterium sp.]